MQTPLPAMGKRRPCLQVGVSPNTQSLQRGPDPGGGYWRTQQLSGEAPTMRYHGGNGSRGLSAFSIFSFKLHIPAPGKIASEVLQAEFLEILTIYILL